MEAKKKKVFAYFINLAKQYLLSKDKQLEYDFNATITGFSQ